MVLLALEPLAQARHLRNAHAAEMKQRRQNHGRKNLNNSSGTLGRTKWSGDPGANHYRKRGSIMIWIVLPMLTMLIGLLMGVCIMDTFYDNKQINQMERRIKRLEKKVNE